MKLSKRDAVSALAAIAAALTPVVALSRTFVHPGLTYTQGDLDRMKAMVEAREEQSITRHGEIMPSPSPLPTRWSHWLATLVASGDADCCALRYSDS